MSKKSEVPTLDSLWETIQTKGGNVTPLFFPIKNLIRFVEYNTEEGTDPDLIVAGTILYLHSDQSGSVDVPADYLRAYLGITHEQACLLVGRLQQEAILEAVSCEFRDGKWIPISAILLVLEEPEDWRYPSKDPE